MSNSEDLLVIETSGLCDPAPVLSTLEQLDDLAAQLGTESEKLRLLMVRSVR